VSHGVLRGRWLGRKLGGPADCEGDTPVQFIVTARDGGDAEAPARRAAARPAHLERAQRLKAEGHMLVGGAILDEVGGMIGSVMLVDFPSRDALDAWLASDPYTTGDVWRAVEVLPFRAAIMPGQG